MKTLKISIAVIVVISISAAILFWIQNIKDPEKPQAPKNLFTAQIEQEIVQINAKPDNKFCKESYNLISANIIEFYNPSPPTYPYGRFGNTQLENDEWKGILEKELYSAYTEKFIKQAKTVFRGSEWELHDLGFIQKEKNELKSSNFFVVNSSVDDEFKSIQDALNQYNEIVSFISSCKDFDYPETDLDVYFPIDDVQIKISYAAALLSNGLENEFVNNCTRLHKELENIPQKLFEIHVEYLDKKINRWKDNYFSYSSHSDYSTNLNIPIKNEIEALDNDTYNVSNFDWEYEKLKNRWSKDSTNAYNYKYPYTIN